MSNPGVRRTDDRPTLLAGWPVALPPGSGHEETTTDRRAEVTGTVRLRFHRDSREQGTHVNLSALRLDGRCLWVAGDETATVERLVASHDGREYRDQPTD